MNNSNSIASGDKLPWSAPDFSKRYVEIRHETQRLSESLEVEDYVVQTMPEVSLTGGLKCT